MRKLILLLIMLAILPVKAHAVEYTAPPAPEQAQKYMPQEQASFADGIWRVIRSGIRAFQPNLAEALGVCCALVCISLLLGVLQILPDSGQKTGQLVGALAIAVTLFGSTRAMIQLGEATVCQVSGYGKLLIPVLTCTLAAQGGATASSALYAGTVIFDGFLASFLNRLMIPMIYIYLCLSVAAAATDQEMLTRLRDSVKNAGIWILRTALYIFTGYMGITGVISGSADKAALKAAKLTISGVVPLVGGILSDASEAVLVSAGVIKNTAGAYGLLAVTAIWIEPFLKIGVQYLLLKLTAGLCTAFGAGKTSGLIGSFSAAMGMLLAVTGAICLMLLISVVCFMKGVS